MSGDGLFADGLAVAERGVGLGDRMCEIGPAFADDGEIGDAVQESVIDAPEVSVGKKRGSAGFWARCGRGIEDAACPVVVALLVACESLGHGEVGPHVFLAVRVIGGHDHAEAVRPPEVVVLVCGHLVSHYLLGAGDLLFIRMEAIEVDVNLEANLPITEEDKVVALIVGIHPFWRSLDFVQCQRFFSAHATEEARYALMTAALRLS